MHGSRCESMRASSWRPLAKIKNTGGVECTDNKTEFATQYSFLISQGLIISLSCLAFGREKIRPREGEGGVYTRNRRRLAD